MYKDKNIIVITGGFSNEREVSLRSGNKVFEALKKQGYQNIELFDLKDQNSIKDLVDKHQQNKYDLAFLTTHGKFGEDGCLQGLLEILRIPYTGSKVMQSAIGMNKSQTKKILFANSLPVLETNLDLDNLVDNEYILKPNTEGSSVGIEKFDNKNDLVKFIKIHEINLEEFVIERFVKGVEVTCSIIEYDLETDPLKLKLQETEFMILDKANNLISLPILELRPKKEFYDYEAKYTQGMTEFILPTSLGINLQKKIHDTAIKAYKALSLNGLARVDFIIENSSKDPYILEVNTLPGMTALSDSPAQALCANISYESLVELIMVDALNSMSSRQRA
jgi:D-alanine-D-alanine ligase